MKKYIEISGRLENGMWGYFELPGLENIIPHVEIKTIATVKKDGFFASRITVSSISGTYLEAGSHMIEGAKNLSDYNINDFIKPAKVIRLSELGAKSLISAKMLENTGIKINDGDAVIIDTGWWRMWNKPGYVLTCPNYLKDALEWILDKNISIFGVDVPCIEASWSENNENEKGSLLTEMFGRGILLAAPLVNLGEIKGNTGRIYCMPMNVEGTSGAPARIIFEENV